MIAAAIISTTVRSDYPLSQGCWPDDSCTGDYVNDGQCGQGPMAGQNPVINTLCGLQTEFLFPEQCTYSYLYNEHCGQAEDVAVKCRREIECNWLVQVSFPDEGFDWVCTPTVVDVIEVILPVDPVTCRYEAAD